MIRTILLIPLMMSLLACGLFTQDEGESAPPVAMVSKPQSPFVGDATLEEKIIGSNTIVRATMTSFSSEVVLVTSIYHDGTDNRYSAVFRFSLSVSEYLKGTGPSNVVAVWFDGHSYETRAEANASLDNSLGRRDSQWDDRQAIIFLHHGLTGFGTVLDTEFQLVDHFYLSFGDLYFPDDHYSLHSKSNKIWLPSVSTATSTGDGQEYLLDVPPTSETIPLGALKALIGAVATELNAGDGSDRYRECVWAKYRHLRNQRNYPEIKGRQYTDWNTDRTIVSGKLAGTVLDRRATDGGYADTDTTAPPLRLEGRDSDLFNIETSTSTIDIDGDGEPGSLEEVQLARPLPSGEYSFDLNEDWGGFRVCNYVVSNEWTVTVVAPGRTLHEFFFDPVTVGTTVAADSSNGVLKPASFTGADGVSSTIERMSWEPSSTSAEAGAAVVEVTTATASDAYDMLGDHILDFIKLDGSVSLSLDVLDATVESEPTSGPDTQSYTLSWTVSSQPWEDGDKLMVRIR